MKKQLLILTLALLVITSTASVTKAENKFTKGLKDIGGQVTQETKGIVKDIQTGVKKDIENTATSTKNAKIAEILKIKNEKLKAVDAEIAAKKAEIDAVKNAKITETERTTRLAILTRQLKYLETKRANVENTYNNKINAFK